MENQPVYMHEFWKSDGEDGYWGGYTEYVLSTLTYLSDEWRHNPEEALIVSRFLICVLQILIGKRRVMLTATMIFFQSIRKIRIT
jgi:hypothetical protein